MSTKIKNITKDNCIYVEAEINNNTYDFLVIGEAWYISTDIGYESTKANKKIEKQLKEE